MPTYTIFAGTNGAGKTSIYKSIYYNENKYEKRVNTDEMVARIGSWEDNNLQIKCAREAVKLAKENGFYVVVNYIGIESPAIAKKRVRIRVSNGGHGIPDEDIERRYYNSLSNLKKVIDICDEINIYDNTEMFREIIDLKNGKIIWLDKKIPSWENDILLK